MKEILKYTFPPEAGPVVLSVKKNAQFLSASAQLGVIVVFALVDVEQGLVENVTFEALSVGETYSAVNRVFIDRVHMCPNRDYLVFRRV